MKKRASRSNQETGRKEKENEVISQLDIKSPIQGQALRATAEEAVVLDSALRSVRGKFAWPGRKDGSPAEQKDWG